MTGMTVVVAAIVAAGIGLALVLGVAAALDATAAVILGAIVAFGVLAIVSARRARGGSVGPERCPDCGGLISPTAPYCKHCGARIAA